jgi:TonB family protein
MNRFRVLPICIALSAVLVSSIFVVAQESLDVSPEVAASHLLKHVDPVYPAFAKAAGIEGTVRIGIGIYADGQIHSVAVEGGPPVLRQAAMETISRYVYKPFEKDGHAVNARTAVDVVFKLASGKGVPLLEQPPKLMREDFTWIERSDSSSDVSAALRKWIATDLSDKKKHTYCDDSECDSLREKLRDPNVEIQDEIAIIELAANHSGAKIYLIRPQIQAMCGATGNCSILLVEENTAGIHSFAETYGGGYNLSPNSRSGFPNIFIASNSGGGIIAVQGFSNFAGEWGQLYCGHITNGDDGEQAENTICH